MPLQSHCPCASIRQKGRPESACLDARSSLSELGCSRSAPPWERTKLQVPLRLVGAALVPGRWEAGPRVEVLWKSCYGVRTGICSGAYLGAWSSASLNLVVFLPATSGSKDQSPEVVVTVVTISALLVLGSVMSVLAIWRR